MKKTWISPQIFNVGLTGEDEGSWQAPGSGQSTPDPDASWSYDDWLEIYADFPSVLNFDGEGESGTWEDYVAWYEHWFNETPTRP